MICKDPASPWTVLGISPGASEDEIRTRYRALVKRHPPEQDPDAFERIRDAYEKVRDPRVLARERVLTWAWALRVLCAAIYVDEWEGHIEYAALLRGVM